MTFDRDMMRGAQQDQILERVAFASSHNGVVTRTARSPCRDVGNMSDDVASVVYQDLATSRKGAGVAGHCEEPFDNWRRNHRKLPLNCG